MTGTRLCLAVMVLLTSAVLSACSPAGYSPPAATEAYPGTAAGSVAGPVLSGALTRGCRQGSSVGATGNGLGVGQRAVDFTLKDTDGREYSLSRLLAKRPVVVVFGSFT